MNREIKIRKYEPADICMSASASIFWELFPAASA